MDIQEINELVKSKSAFISALRTEMQKKIVGQKQTVNHVFLAYDLLTHRNAKEDRRPKTHG